ncbi:DUF421 domain-containing protein [Loktanella sp. DJP18]|uniref:DUF421 domain-containing protein n=1 Tax=Loktanella sp. DJP18 TaxID=3409788 RepID=UPI003BB6DC7D
MIGTGFEIALRTVAAIALVVALARVFGLRSFAKMSGFDFAVTVAIGSVLASTSLSTDRPFWHGALVLTTLFVVQSAVAQLRARIGGVTAVTDNAPLLIMRDGEILHNNLRGAGMTVGDLIGKLREANVLDFTQVRAVVFERTGDVSVLNGDACDDRMLEGVRQA